MNRAMLCLALICLFSLPAAAQSAGPEKISDAELAAIKQPALDYAESYYEGNSERMERALHPDLAKRIVQTDAQGRSRLDHMSAMRLVQIIRGGHGKTVPPERRQKEVTVLDVYRGRIASLKVEMDGWVDYLHVAKFGDRWIIVNVLWQDKPQPAAKP